MAVGTPLKRTASNFRKASHVYSYLHHVEVEETTTGWMLAEASADLQQVLCNFWSLLRTLQK